MIAGEALIILCLTVLNGFFAMSELAIVSARPAKLKALAEEGSRGAEVALRLAAAPGRFLSAVQIGITLIGIFAGAYGGATLSVALTEALVAIPLLAPFAQTLAFGLVVAAITYLSLIVGELVPKQLALRDPERIAVRVARPMRALALIATPLVVLLDASAKLGLRLCGKQVEDERRVSDEEIRMLIAEATHAGVVGQAEQAMLVGVMRLADRPVSALMTPRPDIVWLDLEDDAAALRQQLREASYSRLPVCRGDPDEFIGIVQAKDLLDAALEGQPLDITRAVREVPVVHDGASALVVLEELKRSPVPMALVVDEYGSLRGLVTAVDILASIVGELAETGAEPEPAIVQRDDGSWLIDGGTPIDEVSELLGLKSLPDEGEFNTLAGLVLDRMGHLPCAGEHADWGGWRFEVVDMDGRRIDKVLVARRPAE